MPTLRRYANDAGCFVVTTIKGQPVTFQLTDLGIRHLTKTLRLKDRSHFAREHLIDLVERKWAFTRGAGSGDILAALRSETESDIHAADFQPVSPKRFEPSIEIRFEGGDCGVLDRSLKDFAEAITKGPCTLLGPFPVPTRIESYKVVRTSGATVYEMRTHKRLMIVVNPDAKFLCQTGHLSVPAGVAVKIRETKAVVR